MAATQGGHGPTLRAVLVRNPFHELVNGFQRVPKTSSVPLSSLKGMAVTGQDSRRNRKVISPTPMTTSKMRLRASIEPQENILVVSVTDRIRLT